jgi:hypothetical protein
VTVEDPPISGNRAEADLAGVADGGDDYASFAAVRRARVFGDMVTTLGGQIFGTSAP